MTKSKDAKDTSAAGHFGRQMKKERLAHGWSLQELSQRTVYDAAHLSRIENGLRPPTRTLALACDNVFPERRGWFTNYYDESRKWAEIPYGFRDWAELEDKAACLCAWMPGIVHGLLQTEDYARELVRIIHPKVEPDVLEQRVQVRVRRQQRLAGDNPPRYSALIDEAAFARTMGSNALMVAQVDKILGLVEDGQAVVDAAMTEFGHVDVLVNNAGKGTAVPATRETPDQFREVIDINLNGSYWMAQACGRVMKPGSSIINVASVIALASGGLPQAAYSASKAGVTGLTRDLAVQWTGRKGIRVNALAPGFFPSEMTDEFPEGYIDSQLPRLPAGRPGDPAELAAADSSESFRISMCWAVPVWITSPTAPSVVTVAPLRSKRRHSSSLNCAPRTRFSTVVASSGSTR